MATPRRKTVPDNWKHPLGPWYQAPPEFGGEWWQIWGPFQSKPPWETEGQPLPTDPPAEFVNLFGTRPVRSDPFYGEWMNNLPKELGGSGHFQGVGLPPWMTQADLDTANLVYEAYDMGTAVVYKGRYGWRVRWPKTKMYDFEGDARDNIMTAAMHHKVAEYQDRLRGMGVPITKPHPFLPPVPK